MAGSVRRTVGVEDTLSRPGLVNWVLMGIAEWAQALNEKYSRLGNRPVYDVDEFPWAMDVEREWHHVRAELDNLLTRKDELPGFHEICGELRSISADRDWKTFLFVGYGVNSDEAMRLCPETWRILQMIPGLKTAMFSVFEPGKHLKPHRGPYNGVLRLHLGLIVPDTPPRTVAIRVDDEVCHWQEGKVLIFDDAYEHEAWNHSDETRVVLFVDFVKPLRFPASFVNRLILNIAAFTPFIREGKKAQNDWEKRFFGNETPPETAAPVVVARRREQNAS
jgi:ornithine lipid ester-linked acyl 2-hydroxylase